MNAMKEHAEKCLVTNFIAHIGAYMAPLRKAGVLYIRPTTKPRNIALAGCSRFRMRRIRPWIAADESNRLPRPLDPSRLAAPYGALFSPTPRYRPFRPPCSPAP